MDQKKKIILMAAALGVLLIGFVVIFLWSNLFGSSAKPPGTPVAGTKVPGVAPPVPNKPGVPGIKPGMPGPTAIPGKPGIPNPVGVPMKPGQPVPSGKMTPPGVPVPPKSVAPVNKAPMGRPGAPVGMAGAPNMPGRNPMPAPAGMGGMAKAQGSRLPAFSDPFANYPPKPKPPRHPRGPVVPVYVPPEVIKMYPVPGVNSQPSDGGVRYHDEDSYVPTVKKTQVALDLGRGAGWISGNAQGKVTAFFEARDGSVAALNVDSEIAGYRVKAINIDKHYLLLVNMQTGAEEKVRLQGEHRAPIR